MRSSGSERTTLSIAPGVTIVGVQGDLDAARLPGALIVTRSGRIDAVGTPSGTDRLHLRGAAWLTLAGRLGRRRPARTSTDNVPANFETRETSLARCSSRGSRAPSSRRTAALPTAAEWAERAEKAVEAASRRKPSTGTAGGSSTFASSSPASRLRPCDELNGLTLGGCGRDTVVNRVQVHLGTDDGVEVFGGAVDLRHVVITGSKDDSLDWDQGWRGRAQFIAIQMHDDTALAATDRGDSGIEADGYADPALRFGTPSSPRIFNMTLIANASAGRGIRLREGTQATIRNALILAATGGVASGIVDLGDAITADWVTAGSLSIRTASSSDAGRRPARPTARERSTPKPTTSEMVPAPLATTSSPTSRRFCPWVSIRRRRVGYRQHLARSDERRAAFGPAGDAAVFRYGGDLPRRFRPGGRGLVGRLDRLPRKLSGKRGTPEPTARASRSRSGALTRARPSVSSRAFADLAQW